MKDGSGILLWSLRIKDLADSLTAAEESLAYENLISPARHKIISIINC